MYKIGTVVVYGSEGVCEITEITSMKFANSENESLYYVLSPVSSRGSKVFVPCDNEALVSKMQKVLTSAEIKEMIRTSNEYPEWINDNRQRNRLFKEILMSYDRKKILCLAKLLHTIKTDDSDSRRLLTSDEEILKKIIKILHSEFSIVLDISPDEIIPYIFGEITCNEK